ncbi:hypothetical protein CRYUN_Cryun02cG0012500 [Craigia yunnanensis]
MPAKATSTICKPAPVFIQQRHRVFANFRLNNFPSQTVLLPLSNNSGDSCPDSSTFAAGFYLDALTLRRLSGKPVMLSIEVYTGRMGRTCGVSCGKLVSRLQITMDLGVSQTRPSVFQNGWMNLGNESDKPSAKLHLTVRTEPDPRFVFQFDGEPECSPVVFQIQGNIRQPVFSCKFSSDRSRSRSLPPDFTNKNRGWMRTLSGEKERQGRERKGWMTMIYDLSGSPVAVASMITPFLETMGLSRGMERTGPIDGLGYKFELVTENGPNNGIPIAEATMSVKKGGQFCIDKRVSRDSALSLRSPVKGFVMGSTVEGEGKVSKPVVQVGMQHVTCMVDAALFIALSAAIDLSMDACRLFSRKLRKELCHDEQDSSS